MHRPTSGEEIRLVSLRTIRGANLWSARPVTRVDLAVGAYEDISSADVPGLPEALLRAMPGLIEHRCSIGERGGFLTRLRRGTYAPHILEHVALELQGMIGHDVGFGRARGGDRPGEYTVVFEHRHSEVGLRAAALALETVQQAFAGTLVGVDHFLEELTALAAGPAAPPLSQRVTCAVTGSGDRAAVRPEMLRRGLKPEALVVDLAPAYLLNAGVPFASAEVAVVLEAAPIDVPDRYGDPEMVARLLSVVADAIDSGGTVVIPDGEPRLHELVERSGAGVAVFGRDAAVRQQDRPIVAGAYASGGRIAIVRGATLVDGGALREGASMTVQLAAALAVHLLTPANPVTAFSDAAYG